jgi:hypothetical protein
MTVELQRVYTFDNGEGEMSTHMNLSSEDREQLADEMGVHESDVDAETVIGYVEELREAGHGSDAARVIAYLEPDDERRQLIETDASDDLYRQLAATLGLPSDDSAARSFEEEEEAEAFDHLRPYLGLDK